MKALRILVCPLDWGLGHATRCVPIIRQLIQDGHHVILGLSNSNQEALLYEEFPGLEQKRLPAYSIRYPNQGYLMPFWLMRKIPRLLKIIRQEQIGVDAIVKQAEIDVVISDNRFGCWSHKTLNIYMTHQIRIAFPTPFQFLEFLGVQAHGYLYRNFHQVWIPDIPRYPGLAGKLSHAPCKLPIDWLGPLSRLPSETPKTVTHPELELLALVSGPEPHRSNFESQAIELANHWRGKSIIVQGLPEHAADPPTINGSVHIYAHASAKVIASWIHQSKRIICRSGYSTLMDLATLSKSAEWFPTPGQTEQEYLAELHHNPLKSMQLLDSDFQLLPKAIQRLTSLYQNWKSSHE